MILDILRETYSDSYDARKAALEKLEKALHDNYGKLIEGYFSIFRDESQKLEDRQLVATQLKNAISAWTSADRALFLSRNWLTIPKETRAEYKSLFLSYLKHRSRKISRIAAQLIASIAVVELPSHQWPKLIENLCAELKKREILESDVSICILLSLEYICQELRRIGGHCKEQAFSQHDIDNMLNTLVFLSNPDSCKFDKPILRFHAVSVLHPLLYSCDKTFEREFERGVILKTLFGASKDVNPQVACKALECLSSVSEEYYESFTRDHLEEFVDIIKLHTRKAPDVLFPPLLAALMFWRSLADVEEGIVEDVREHLEVEYREFVVLAIDTLLPLFLRMIATVQDEYVDESIWDASAAAVVTLKSCGKVVGVGMIDKVLMKVIGKLTSSNWKEVYGSVMVAGAVLEGIAADPMSREVAQKARILEEIQRILSVMFNLTIKTPQCTASAAMWFLQHAVGLFPKIVTVSDNNLRNFVLCASTALKDGGLGYDIPILSSNACNLFANIAKVFQPSKNLPGNDISEHAFQGYIFDVIDLLLTTAGRSDSTEANLRTAAHAAIDDVVLCVPNRSLDRLPQVIRSLMRELEKAYDPSLDQGIAEDRQSLVLMNIGTVISRIGADKINIIQKEGNGLITACTTMLKESKFTSVREECFSLLSTFAEYFRGNFAPIFCKIARDVYKAAMDVEYMGVVVSAFRFINAVVENSSAGIKDELKNILSLISRVYPSLSATDTIRLSKDDEEVKPEIIALLGTMSLVYGDAFIKEKITFVLGILNQASSVKFASEHDIAGIGYVQSLRVSILGAFDMLIQGSQLNRSSHPLYQYGKDIIMFIKICVEDEHADEEIYNAAAELLIDFIEILGKDNVPDEFVPMPPILRIRTSHISTARDGTRKEEGGWHGYDQSYQAQNIMKVGYNSGHFTHISIPFTSSSPLKGAYICLHAYSSPPAPSYLIFTLTSLQLVRK
ncbi:Importin beta family like protein [Aduncisulcus paluster]|uniref:Importin beta family like protein n=1 Tax=Aduncisulcus paluster TaxID=2918883 RepID=A0ABQ5JYM4_9EUKA|nr:Importin beta family like protein [Aduncisulcus paluster]